MSIVSMLLQPEKAAFPITLTELPIATFVKRGQSEKAFSPIDIILLGMIILLSLVQLEKALSLIHLVFSFNS